VLVLILAMRMLERLGAASLGQFGFFAALLSVTLLGTLVCAEVLHRFVEKPCMAFGRNRPAPSGEAQTAAL
jgi:peptidoglycan/LPS O-acetylase OafA/YrhL